MKNNLKDIQLLLNNLFSTKQGQGDRYIGGKRLQDAVCLMPVIAIRQQNDK